MTGRTAQAQELPESAEGRAGHVQLGLLKVVRVLLEFEMPLKDLVFEVRIADGCHSVEEFGRRRVRCGVVASDCDVLACVDSCVGVFGC
jgi:hypothetical protein